MHVSFSQFNDIVVNQKMLQRVDKLLHYSVVCCKGKHNNDNNIKIFNIIILRAIKCDVAYLACLVK